MQLTATDVETMARLEAKVDVLLDRAMSRTPAPNSSPARRIRVSQYALIGGVVLAILAMIGLALAPRPAPTAVSTSAYMQAVGSAPGYADDVIAAGFDACGAFERGQSYEAWTADAVVNGINGDLYPREGVEQIAAAAPRFLCP